MLRDNIFVPIIDAYEIQKQGIWSLFDTRIRTYINIKYA
jgi:hypothetical protein